jgi:3'-phosphoadenosine 5'-phosphosulfate sulfotransferase (PAPS reductase)/FAD synthetase
MNETLSFSEIKERFVSEWVLIVNPETDEDLNIKKGKILWHSKDRDEVYRKAREIHPAHSAIIFTGQLPDNVAVIL